jgi:intein-encoded DNA endonuclease-like protein
MILSKEYIAGFFDADGSVSIIYQRVKRGQSLRPEVSIVQNNVPMLNVIKDSLNSYGIGCHISLRKYKATHRLMVNGLKRVEKFIDTIGPYIVLKRKEIELIGKFVDGRLSINKNVPYNEWELSLPGKLKNLKKHRLSLRDYTRDA